jgi:hypothetical protein
MDPAIKQVETESRNEEPNFLFGNQPLFAAFLQVTSLQQDF